MGYKLLKLADYTTETRDFLLDVGGYTDTPSTWNGEDFDGEDSNFIRKRRRSISPNSLTESKIKAIEHPPADFTNDEIRMIRRNAALLNGPFDVVLPKIRNERSISHLQKASNEFANVARRWRSFAEDYKKNWNTGALIFREEAEIGEGEEEGGEIRVVEQEEEEEEEEEEEVVEEEEGEEEGKLLSDKMAEAGDHTENAELLN